MTGILEAMKNTTEKPRMAILTDSPAAIMSIKKAGRTGRANTRELRKVMEEIGRRKERFGDGATTFGWVKAHIGIPGNEEADRSERGSIHSTGTTYDYGRRGPTGVEKEKRSREEGEGDWGRKGDSVEPESATQLCSVAAQEKAG